MSTVAQPLHPLLDDLVDFAALFPPASRPMTEALDAYLGASAGPYSSLLGRFLCPASRVAELASSLEGRVAPEDDLLLGLVADNGLDGSRAAIATIETHPRLLLCTIEYPVPADAGDLVGAVREAVERLPDVAGYVELPRGAQWTAIRAALAVLADSPYGAKLRTGGTSAAAFPTEAEVARFLRACVQDELPFKCTAGLHAAVRHTAPHTGFEHHGFLNLLVATSAAVGGASLAQLERVVAERDPTILATRVAAMDTTDAVVARSFFVAFGSCDLDEPVSDLAGLRLLDIP